MTTEHACASMTRTNRRITMQIPDTSSSFFSSSIAVIGIGCRFPCSKNPAEFWKHLCSGQEGIVFFSEETAREKGVPETLLRNPHYVRAYGSLGNIPMFDPAFFGLTAREAAIMDPQHRHFLECAWETLEQAGCVPEDLQGDIGVFAGSGMNHYFPQHILPHQGILETEGAFFARHTGNDRDFLATRVSYCFNLKGPSINVQTGCSTSLVAVHMACQSLLNHECKAALAGAVSIENLEEQGYLYQPGFILSPDGMCRAFDSQAQGTVFSNGVGLVLLKRLEDALANNDTIHAILRGTAINNDGHRKQGYTAPSTQGQAEVMQRALQKAQCKPSDITCIEAHGSGTVVGDPIEWNAFLQAYQEQNTSIPCKVGSVKTNVGHLDTAAGIAGLIKMCFAVKTGLIPPTLHFSKPHPLLNIQDTRFSITHTLETWPETPKRIGAVNSLGIGGTNAHVVVEEPPIPQASPEDKTPVRLYVVSGETQEAMLNNRLRLADFLTENPQSVLSDVAYTLQKGRKHRPHRSFVVATHHEDTVAQLRAPVSNETYRLFNAQATTETVWMFPGNGTFYPGLAQHLYQQEPVFQNTFLLCAKLFKPLIDADLTSCVFTQTHQESSLTTPLISVPALFSIEIALVALWQSWGFSPSCMIGHSMGEYAAAYVAGVFSLEDAVRLVACRAHIFNTMPKGGMLSIPLEASRVEKFLTPTLSIAAYNAPSACVVSGDIENITLLQNNLLKQGVETKWLHMPIAAHSAMLDPYLDRFLDVLKNVAWHMPQQKYISTVTGDWIEPHNAVSCEYWVQHLRHPVYFSKGIEKLLSNTPRVFIEMGPGHVLSSLLKMHTSKKPFHTTLTTLPSAQDPTPSNLYAYTALGKTWLHGLQPTWEHLYQGYQPKRTPLPTYAFDHQHYWVPAPEKQPQGHAQSIVIPKTKATQQQPLSNASATEQALHNIWSSLLGVQHIARNDTFFDLGGHSLLAVRLFASIKDTFGVDLTLSTLFEAPTLQACASYIDTHMQKKEAAWSPLVKIQTQGDRIPFFCVHGAGGNVLNFALLSKLLGPKQPFYGLQAQGVDGVLPVLESIEAMASLYLDAVLKQQPHGPYVFGGYSGGGVVALEMAQQAVQKGLPPPCVVLFDTYHPQMDLNIPSLKDHMQRTLKQGPFYLSHFLKTKTLKYWKKHQTQRALRQHTQSNTPLPHHLRDTVMTQAYFKASSAYIPKPYHGTGMLFKAAYTHPVYSAAGNDFGWSDVFTSDFKIYSVGGDHEHMMEEPHVHTVVEHLQKGLFSTEKHGFKNHETLSVHTQAPKPSHP
jgi:phthiocerol/phenolphthiocerol synthesis type-I polyketide synthase E